MSDLFEKELERMRVLSGVKSLNEAYSPYAEVGKKIHGKEWKGTIRLGSAMRKIQSGLEEMNDSEVESQMRMIASRFQSALDEVKKQHPDELDDHHDTEEAIEWFSEETLSYWFGEDDIEGFEDEFNNQLEQLYNFSDLYRYWVKSE